MADLTDAERPLLERMLDAQRAAIAGLLEGLDEEQARRRLVPSATSPIALVKHATGVETVWFGVVVDGVARAELGVPENMADSFVLGPDDTAASVVAAFLAAGETSRRIAADHDLDETFQWRDNQVSLRFIHVHLIAEFARHAGHGDILLEQIRAGRN